jgi:stearoyl-CoA desaturase (delta-9 desaturase)
LLTHGEGYHNFHHKFQIDYRNGIKWYHWDPTKWVIEILNVFGLASRLRKISNIEILKAELLAQSDELKLKGFAEESLQNIREKIIDAQKRIKKLHEDYAQFKKEAQRKRDELRESYDLKLLEMRREIQIAKIEFQVGMKQWQIFLRARTAL